jgi:hypothetical protein
MSEPKKKRAIFRFATERDAAYAAARDEVAKTLIPPYNQRRIARLKQIENIGAEIEQLTLKITTISQEIDAAEANGDEDLAEQLLDDLEYLAQKRNSAEAERIELAAKEGQESASESQLLKRDIASKAAAEVEQQAVCPRTSLWRSPRPRPTSPMCRACALQTGVPILQNFSTLFGARTPSTESSLGFCSLPRSSALCSKPARTSCAAAAKMPKN